MLYGFSSAHERAVFRRLLAATGVGPALALGMLSRFSADRLVRAIREKDVDTLQSVPRVGRKKAQQLVLDLADKLDDLSSDGAAARRHRLPAPTMPSGHWYPRRCAVEAEKAVREALAAGGGQATSPRSYVMRWEERENRSSEARGSRVSETQDSAESRITITSHLLTNAVTENQRPSPSPSFAR